MDFAPYVYLLFNTLTQFWGVLMSTWLFSFPIFIAIVYMIAILILKGRNKN